MTLTADASYYIELFTETHEVRQDPYTGGVRVERTTLPRGGGILDQDAKEMEAIDLLAGVLRAILSERAKYEKSKQKANERTA